MGQSLLSREIVKRSVPFADLKDFNSLLEICKDKKIVMLGESSHGTREFYEWRSLITSELLRKHGFKFIAVEGDWSPCQSINNFVRRKSFLSSKETLTHFNRWPTWMWANEEMVKFMDWLKEWNLDSPDMFGFHGLDVYSLYQSIDSVIKILEKEDSQMASRINHYFSCFEPYLHDEKAYARSLFEFPEGCEEEVSKALAELMSHKMGDEELAFDLKQNALIIQNAENYYRSVVFKGRKSSWNKRDKHMLETLQRLLEYYGEDSKVIVWAHNSHVGDYRATDMQARGQVNLGGLAREKFGKENVSLVGFTTYSGEVIASRSWGGPIEVKRVPKAKEGSLEDVMHSSIPFVGHPDFYLIFNQLEAGSPLLDYRAHRAIGVVYDPINEKRRNYVPTSVSERYDALVFLDNTHALSPLGLDFDKKKFPQTYPSDDLGSVP
jgi:erythromycin esterase